MSLFSFNRRRNAIARAASTTTKAIIEALEKRQYLSTVVYSNDFETAIGSAWSKQSADVTPAGSRKFLGQFSGGNNGFLTGGATWTTARSGRTGSAVQLDGSTGYIALGNDETLATLSGTVTVSAWVKFGSVSGTPVIVDTVPLAGGSGYQLGIDSGKLYFEVRNGSNIYNNKSATGGTTLTTGTWYQVTGTFSGGAVTTYINGTQDRQQNTGGALGGGGVDAVIGRRKGTTGHFLNGAIDDIQIFNRALSQSEVSSLPTGNTTGLMAFLKLDENTATRVLDSANAQGVKLTLTNLPSHSNMTLSFDLYVIGSWDGRSTGNFGPDIFTVTEDGNTVLNTTFANGNTSGQSYPGTYPGASNPKQTGASEIGQLGYGSPSDAVYHIVLPPFTHTNGSVVINFTASDLQGLGDESWGLDNVSVSVLTPIDLSVSGVSDADEETRARVIPVNANFDEGNTDSVGNPLADNEQDAAHGQRIVSADPDLVDASVALNGQGGTWNLTFPDKLMIWRESSPGVWDVPVISGEGISVAAGTHTVNLKIEGIAPSTSLLDAGIVATLTPTSGSSSSDTVNLTVGAADLDVDSDNNNLYDLPAGSRQEEKLEDVSSAPGKIVYVNDNDNDSDGVTDNVDGYDLNGTPGDDDNQTANEKFVPVTFRLDGPFDPSTAAYTISYNASDPIADVDSGVPAAGLRLWMKNGAAARNGSSVADGGDYLAPGTYSGSALGLSSGTKLLTLWLEAANLPATARQQISVAVDPDGASGPSAAVLTDSVAVTVEPSSEEGAVITGYKWNDINGDGIRNAATILGNPPRLIYVIDVSSSTLTPLKGFETLGDVNDDGQPDTTLDAEIAAFQSLTTYLEGQTYASTPQVSIIVFAGQAVPLDMDGDATNGTQLSAPVSDDINTLLSKIHIGYQNSGDGTNYVAAINSAQSVSDTLQYPANQTNVVFLSDGYPNPDNPAEYTGPAKVLGEGRAVFALGAGDGAKTDALSIVASPLGASGVFHTRDALRDYFGAGLGGFKEGPVANVRIYADLDNDGTFDAGTDEEKYSSITDDDGNYAIIGLPAGTYHIREVKPDGWVGTFPAGGSATVIVTAGEVSTGNNFGNQFQGSVDLDVDSDNTHDPSGGPDRDSKEESIEDDPTRDGKKITVDDDDTDNNSLKDFAQLNAITGDHFTPMVLDVSTLNDLAHATFSFVYDGSDPAAATSTAPAPGTLRVWLKDANVNRVLTDYLQPGVVYSASALGLSNSTKTITLYVEGIAVATSDAQRLVQVNVVPDTTATSQIQLSDAVYITPQGTGAAGTVSGDVFSDADGDGVHDSGETPAPGVRVYVDVNGDGQFTQQIDPTAITDSSGLYTINNVPDGTWSVRVSDPGTRTTAPASGTHTVAIGGGHGVTGQEFGIAPVSGAVFIEPGPTSVDEGTPVQFTARVSDPVALTYTWEWVITRDNGQYIESRDVADSATSSLLKFAPADDGAFQITAIAKANNVEVGRDTVDLNVKNVVPSGTITVHPGTSVGPNPDGSAPTITIDTLITDPGALDLGGMGVGYTFTLNGAPYTPPNIVGGAGIGNAFMSFTADQVGTYVVSVHLDDHDLHGTATIPSPPIIRTADNTSVSGKVVYDDFQTEESESTIGLAGYRVYYDANSNGHWDENDFSAVTAVDGTYEIKGLPTNTLTLHLDAPTAWITDPSSGTNSVTPIANDSVTNVDFKVHPSLAFSTQPSSSFSLNPHSYQFSEILGTPWKPGDLVYYDSAEQGLYLVHRDKVDADGNLESGAIEKLAGSAQGKVAFDANGNILAPFYSEHQVNELSANGLTFRLFTDAIRYPEDIVVDRAGNIYISGNAGNGTPDPTDSRRSGIYKFDNDGSLLAWLAQGVRVDEFALAPDQHSIVFDQGQNLPGTVFRLDTNTGEITDLGKYEVVGGFEGLQILGSSANPSDWRIALITPGAPVSGTSGSFYLLDWSGKLLQKFDATGFDIALDNTPGYLWVSDGGLTLYDWRTGQSVTSLEVTGNAAALTVYSPPGSNGQVGSVYTYDARATQPGIDDTPLGKNIRESFPIRYSLVSATPGTDATIDPVTGRFTFTPTAVGSYQFVIQAEEQNLGGAPTPDRGVATQTINVDVATSGANDTPTITDQNLPDGRVGLHYSGLVAASDADNDELKYSLAGSPNAKIDPLSGLLTFTPMSAGDQTFVVQVEDGRGGVSQASVTVHVFAPLLPTNTAPTISNVNSSYTIAAGSLLTIDNIGLSDADLADIYQMTLSATTKPDGLVVSQMPEFSAEIPSASGKLTWRPKLADEGKTFDVTLQLSDGRGGIDTKSFTIAVTVGAPAMDSVRVVPGKNPETQRTLSVLTYDAETLQAATFTWECTDTDQPVFDNEQKGAVIDVTFQKAGVYHFVVTAHYTPPGGTEETSTLPPVEVTIDPVIKRVAPVLRSIVVNANSTLNWLSAKMYDQFNQVITSDDTNQLRWSNVRPNETINPLTSAYTVPSNPTDTADTIVVEGGTVDGSSVFHSVASSTIAVAIAPGEDVFTAVASPGAHAVEAQNATFNVTGGVDNSLGSFVDTSVSSIDPADYDVQIDWGDGLHSQGGLQPFNSTGIIPSGQPSAYAFITGSHPYGLQGTYNVKVVITELGGLHRQINVPTDGSIPLVVDSAPIVVSAVAARPVNGRPFSGVIAHISDPATITDPSRFAAQINWADGTVTTIKDPLGEYDIRKESQGEYDIVAKHLYNGEGPVPASIDIYENYPPYGNNSWVKVASQDLNIVVGASDLTVPTNVVATKYSSTTAKIAFDHNPDTAGFIITRIQMDSDDPATAHEIGRTPLQMGNQYTVSDPYVDRGLTANSYYRYIVTAADQYLNESSPSDPSGIISTEVESTTPPSDVKAVHTSTIDPLTHNREAGIQLSWTPTDHEGYGYLVERQTGTSGPFTSVLPANTYLDPADAIDGKLEFFDDFGTADPFPAGVTSYTYHVITVDLNGNAISGGTATINVLRSPALPAPTNVQAASFPQAIQLTWDDRDGEDPANENFAGWNVYRYQGTETPVRINVDLVTENTGYNDTTAQEGETYTYDVRAVDFFGKESDGVSVTHRKSRHGEPPMPKGLTAIPAGTDIVLNWEAVTPEVDTGFANDALQGYRVYGSSTANFVPSASSLITEITRASASDPLPATTYTDSVGTNATRYYAVTAIDFDVNTATPPASDPDESSPAFVTGHSGAGHTLAAPTDLDAPSANITQTTITLSWTASTTTSVTGYRVFRAEGDSNAFVLLDDTATTAAYTDENLSPGTTYKYRVYAIDGDGDFSPPATVLGSSDTTLSVSTEDAPDQRPSIHIETPASRGDDPLVVSSDLNVTGWVDDLNTGTGGLDHWRLVLRPWDATDGTSDYIVNAGVTEVGHVDQAASLGQIKPALIPDGEYHLILMAFDNPDNHHEDTAHQSIEYFGSAAKPIQIRSDVKAGMFTLPVVDLQVKDASGQSITVARTYDSQHANEKGDFGYGWKLQLDDVNYHTTAREADGEALGTTPTLRFGDLVYLTIPGQGQHVFAFTPRPLSYSSTLTNPTDLTYAGGPYAPQFVAVDGSNAVLTVPRDGDDSSDPFFLSYNPYLKQFNYESENGIQPYNPSNPDLGNELRVLEPDGTKYFINAETGKLKYSVNAMGKTTYYDDQANSGELRLNIVRYTLADGAKAGLIREASVVNSAGDAVSKTVVYTYDDDTLNLLTATEQISSTDHPTTTYNYEDPIRPHYLTSIDDPRGVESIKASYDPKTGQLAAATDALGNKASLGTGSFDGDTLRNTVTDLAVAKGKDGQQTQLVQDEHGNVIREIQKVMHNGVVTGYIVTAHDFTYGSGDDIVTMMNYGISDANALIETRDYDPIQLSATATLQDLDMAKGKLRQISDYYTFTPTGAIEDALAFQKVKNAVDPNLRQLGQTTTFDDQRRPRTTTYSEYKLGKPQKVIDPDGVVTYSKYSDEGLLLWTANAIGEGTEFEYLSRTANPISVAGDEDEPDAVSGNPGGLLSKTYQIKIGPLSGKSLDETLETALNASDADSLAMLSRIGRVGLVDHPLQTNEYYDDTDPIGSRWRLKSTIDAAGITTVFAYDGAGNQVISAKLYVKPRPGLPLQPVTDFSERTNWVVDETVYDSANRVVATKETVYGRLLSDPENRIFHWHLETASDETSHVVVDEPIVQATRSLSTTTYDSLGKVFQTTDEYGGITENHYDDRGNLVETVNPDGTKTVSAYDVMGRVVASTGRFMPGQSDPVIATLTVYDGQGRVSQTQRVSVAASDIVVSQDPTLTRIYRLTTLGTLVGTGLSRHTNATTGAPSTQPAWWELAPVTDPISKTFTYYDEQGRVVETKAPDTLVNGVVQPGLRTGTVYDGLGRVVYTGPLSDTAPVGAATYDHQQFSITDFVSYTQTQYDVVDVDTIQIGGSFTAGDEITVTFNDVGHHNGETGFKNRDVLTFTFSDTASLLSAIASSITSNAGTSTDLLQNMVSASVSESTVKLTWTNSPGIVADVSTNSANGLIYTTASRHSTLTRDPRGYYTASTSDIAGRADRTIFDDGTFTKTEYTTRETSATPLDVPAYDPDHNNQQQRGISQAELDKFGVVRQEKKIDQKGRETVYLYDLSGRLVFVVQPDPDDLASGNGPEHQPVWRYRYDLNGNLAQTLNPRAEMQDQTNFNPLGNREYQFAEEDQYDEFGRMVQQDRFGNQTGSLTTKWTYDVHGRVATETDPAGDVTIGTYDDSPEHGGRIDHEDRYDHDDLVNPRETTTYTYDDLGRHLTVEDQRDDDNNNAYDPGETDETTSYGYDPMTGGVIFVATPEGVTHHTYDPATGRLTSTWTDTASSTPETQDIADAVTRTDYTYDNRGRLNAVGLVRRAGADVTANGWTSYQYDEAGNLTNTAIGGDSADVPGRISTGYTYDDLNRLTDEGTGELIHNGSSLSYRPIFGQHYTLDTDGQRKSVTETRYDSTGALYSTTNITWDYDNLNRLIEEDYDQDLASVSGNETTDDYTDTYTLDEQGNRTEKVHDADGTDNDRTEEYTYRAGIEQLSGVTIKNHDDTVVESIDYSYDANGAQTTSYSHDGFTPIQRVVYTYDLRGRVITSTVVNKDGSGSAPDNTTEYHFFTYGADGRRVKDVQRVSDDPTSDIVKVTTRVMDDANPTGYSQVLEERTGDTDADAASAAPTTYTIGADVLGQWDASAASAVCYIIDGHGSVRGTVDGSGVVDDTQVYNYDAFGNPLGFDPTQSDPNLTGYTQSTLLYAGEWWDTSTQAVDLRARPYVPSIGRFPILDNIQIEPGDLVDANMYGYLGGNPVLNGDPSGQSGFVSLMVTVAIMDVLLTLGGCNKPTATPTVWSASNYNYYANAAISTPGFSGAFTLKYLPKDAAGNVGFRVTYTPAKPAPGGTRIGLVQAIRSSGQSTKIDLPPGTSRTNALVAANSQTGINPPFIVEGDATVSNPDPTDYGDAPSTTKMGLVSHSVTIVAIQRSTPSSTSPINPNAPDVVLGALNIEIYNGDIIVSDTIHLNANSPNTPISIPAQQPSQIWFDAKKRWENKIYP
jgi:RHS repeat-associated protein